MVQTADIIASKGELTPQSQWKHWKPVTHDEMKAVLAYMGLLNCPEIEGYWKTSWESYIPFFHDVLSHNRFEEIYWMLHLPESAPTHHIDKVRPLLDTILTSFQSAFYPGCDIAVDETMVGFKGRVSVR